MECLNDIINDIVKYASIFTFLIGLVIGNRISIDRDKRKEFNDLTLTFHTALNDQLRTGGRTPTVDLSKSYLIEPYISFCKIRGFRKTIAVYKEAGKNKNTYDVISGKVVYNNEILLHIITLNHKLLTYLKQR